LQFQYKTTTDYKPLDDSFLVLIIFAANSYPVVFCMQRRTTEKAPLNKQEAICMQMLHQQLQHYTE